MAYPGRTIHNCASGERITFRQTAAETNGELVAVDLKLPQDARAPAGLHSHPLQQESFEVVNGTMSFSEPPDLALSTRKSEQEVHAALPPRWLQRLALAPLAWLAKHRGHAARYAPI